MSGQPVGERDVGAVLVAEVGHDRVLDDQVGGVLGVQVELGPHLRGGVVAVQQDDPAARSGGAAHSGDRFDVGTGGGDVRDTGFDDGEPVRGGDVDGDDEAVVSDLTEHVRQERGRATLGAADLGDPRRPQFADDLGVPVQVLFELLAVDAPVGGPVLAVPADHGVGYGVHPHTSS